MRRFTVFSKVASIAIINTNGQRCTKKGSSAWSDRAFSEIPRIAAKSTITSSHNCLSLTPLLKKLNKISLTDGIAINCSISHLRTPQLRKQNVMPFSKWLCHR